MIVFDIIIIKQLMVDYIIMNISAIYSK